MPDNDGGVAKKVAGAKKALASANNSNVSTRSGKPFGDAGAAAAEPAKKKPGILEGLKSMADQRSKEADSTAEGLKAKQDNVDAYKKATDTPAIPKMHKGGKVEKDGPHNLKKGEVVLTAKDAKKKGVADGMKSEAGEEKSEKKDSAKEEKKEHKGKKSRKRLHIHPAASGGFIVKHEPMDMSEPNAQSEEHVVPDMAGLHAHIDEHMGDQGGAPDQGAAPAAPVAAQ